MSLSDIRKRAIVLTAVSLAGVMFHLEISSVPVILSTLETVLHGDFKSMQWVMNAYTIACTTVLMVTGTLADRYGRKRIFILSLALFAVTSLMCGLAQDMSFLIVSRFLQGLGGGAMIISQIAVLSHQFQTGRARSRAFAVWGLVFGIGLGLGPLIGGLIVALSSWRWIFLIHVPLAALTAGLVFQHVDESRNREETTLDLAGLFTLAFAVLGATYFITQGSSAGFAGGIGVLLAATISLAAFIVIESRHPRPMFDFSVFRIRPLSGALVGSVAMNVSFWPFNIYLPIYFQGALGYTPVAAGACLLAYTLPTLVMPPLAERLMLRYNPRVIIPFGLFTIGLGLFLIRVGSGLANAGWLTVIPGCLVAGCGLGFTNTTVTNTATGAISTDRAGMAAGIDMSARLITFAINIALMGSILSQGILAYLNGIWSNVLDESRLRALAGIIATGNLADLARLAPAVTTLDPSGRIAHAALVHGFSSVLLYGSLAAWVLAAVSFAIFGPAGSSSNARDVIWHPEEERELN
ncbi:MFS transporter [Burkholderia paludis]|uniref:MFS transporter n=1 Tax=Burkholderia paludis TaxID=1506587 RepID=UPI00068A095E|nr:MFS transporter [Burkholderia paludis]